MVRAISAYFVILVVVNGASLSAAAKEVFASAQEAYSANQCDKALQLYSSLEAKGPAVWYNMGNCLLKQGHYAKAVACFKRAQKNASWKLYADTVYNIDLAQQKAALSLPSSWRHYVYEMVVYYTQPFSTLLLQLLCIAWWLLTIFLVWVGANRYIGLSRYSYIIIALLGLLFFGGILFVRYKQLHTVVGVITKKDSILYVVPDEHVDSVCSVHETEIVTILDEKMGWYKVKTSQSTGWIKAPLVERV